MNPYMSFLVQPFVATLKDYSSGKLSDPVLWTGILDIFTKSLISDDGGASGFSNLFFNSYPYNSILAR